MPTIKTALTVLTEAYEVLCYTPQEIYPTNHVAVPTNSVSIRLFKSDFIKYNTDASKDLINSSHLYAYLTTLIYVAINQKIEEIQKSDLHTETKSNAYILASNAHTAYCKLIRSLRT